MTTTTRAMCIHGHTSEHTVEGDFVDWKCGPTDPKSSLPIALIAEIGTYSEPDYTAAVIAHRFGVSSDAIIDTVAEIAERLTIAEDLREDPEHAMFLHYDETYHGGDMTGLIEHELNAAYQLAEKLAEMVTR